MDDRGIYQSSLATRIATLVHAHFDALPARCKPRSRPDGTYEWIPMSGIVLAKGSSTIFHEFDRADFVRRRRTRKTDLRSYRVRNSYLAETLG